MMADGAADRWRRIEAVLDEVLELSAETIPAYLDEACAGDTELRAEIEALLAADREAGDFLETPAGEYAATLVQEMRPGSLVGVRIGNFHVSHLLGAGGMGEVYSGYDKKLQRKVAIKAMRRDAGFSPNVRRRFLREAQLLSALDHPNICRIYDYIEDDDGEYLVLELIEGKTLNAAIEGLEPQRKLDIACDIASVLSAAHGQNIIHRDLKPGNVMLTEAGEVKVLDFGLARHKLEGTTTLSFRPGESESPEALPRSSVLLTAPGAILGTPGYVSPEQARGEQATAASDMYSFGLLLQELWSGKPPFPPGLGRRSLLERSMRGETPPAEGAGRGLRLLVEELKSLEPSKRPTALEAHSRLCSIREKPLRRLRQLAVAAALIIAFVLGKLFLGRPAAKPELANPVQLTTATGFEDYMTWSPHEDALAYDATAAGIYSRDWDVWILSLGSGQAVNRTGEHDGMDRYPSWSPDGSQIAFWSDRDGGGYFVLPAFGGSPRKVFDTGLLDEATFSTFGPLQWSADARKVAFAGVSPEPSSFIGIRTLDSGETRVIKLPGLKDRPRQDLSWSPDGRFFAYVAALGLTADISRLWLLRVSDERAIPLTSGLTKDCSPSWSSDSRTLYYISNRGGSLDLWQQALTRDGTPDGPPDPLTAGMGMRRARIAGTGTRLAYSKGQRTANLWQVPVLPDRQAKWADARQLTFEEAFIESIDISSDGKRLVLSSDRAGNHDLWVIDIGGSEMRRLTNHPTPDWAPQWSPDGSQIAFYSYRGGNRDIWILPTTGGQARQLTSTDFTEANPSWSPDGAALAFVSDRGGHIDLWVVGADGTDPYQVTNDAAAEVFPLWSRDGAQIIYAHVQGGLRRVPATGGTPERLGDRHAIYPQWSPDGQHIFFIGVGPDSGLWALSLVDGSERRLTNLEGRRGNLGIIALATDGESLFFTWEEDLGDLWVIDFGQ